MAAANYQERPTACYQSSWSENTLIRCQEIPNDKRTRRKSCFLNSVVYAASVFIVLYHLSFVNIIPIVDAKRVFKCSVCKTITSDFEKGLTATARSNYGGGNTKWEEKSLGSYGKSEIRLVEIMEYVCKGGDKDCHYTLEEHEELIEEFWFKEYGAKNNTDLHSWLCIERMKACCPDNRFGPNCEECKGGKERPCTGNGACDGGGTREGKGTCNCNYGYQGEMCDECTDDHFEEMKNTTHTICTRCDTSCKSGCWEAGPKGCDECKDGYELVDKECKDIDECIKSLSEGNEICGEDKLCVNSEGSYTCHEKPTEDTNTEDDNDDNEEQNDNDSGNDKVDEAEQSKDEL